jgi:hypothetical protein
MIKFLLAFIIIWGAWLVCCSQIFALLFHHDNEDFKNIPTSFLTLLNASFNNFDFSHFTEARSASFGRYLFVINIVISSLFLMNMIVSELTNIYKSIMLKIDADYNANLVMEESKRRWDFKSIYVPTHTLVPPPLNIISIILTIFQLMIKKKNPSEEKTKKLNYYIAAISFFPIAFILFILFLLGTIVMLPFAYLKGIILCFIASRGTN